MDDDIQADQPDETTTLTDDEIETRAVGSTPSASLDDDSDAGDTDDTGDDTGDDSGDEADTGDDTGDESDTVDVGDDSGDTGDDSGDDSGDSDS